MVVIRSPIWSTPDQPPTVELICRRLVFPIHLVEALNGALSLLLIEDMWKQVGTETIESAVEYFDQMWLLNKDGCSMIGEIKMHTLAVLPDTWLKCDGAQYARVDYPDLYDAMNTNYHIDADNFVVPDYGAKFPMGNHGAVSPGDSGGEASVTLAKSEMPAHKHGTTQFQNVPLLEGLGVPYPFAVTAPALPANTNTSGGGNPHNNIPPYEVCNFAIVAK